MTLVGVENDDQVVNRLDIPKHHTTQQSTRKQSAVIFIQIEDVQDQCFIKNSRGIVVNVPREGDLGGNSYLSSVHK